MREGGTPALTMAWPTLYCLVLQPCHVEERRFLNGFLAPRKKNAEQMVIFYCGGLIGRRRAGIQLETNGRGIGQDISAQLGWSKTKQQVRIALIYVHNAIHERHEREFLKVFK